jgi:hypothetical protein
MLPVCQLPYCPSVPLFSSLCPTALLTYNRNVTNSKFLAKTRFFKKIPLTIFLGFELSWEQESKIDCDQIIVQKVFNATLS